MKKNLNICVYVTLILEPASGSRLGLGGACLGSTHVYRPPPPLRPCLMVAQIRVWRNMWLTSSDAVINFPSLLWEQQDRVQPQMETLLYILCLWWCLFVCLFVFNKNKKRLNRSVPEHFLEKKWHTICIYNN